MRELRNYVERCLALREQPPLTVSDMPAGPVQADAKRPLREERQRWTRLLERSYLETILRNHGGNVSAAARSAAVDRVQFYRLLWRNGLR